MSDETLIAGTDNTQAGEQAKTDAAPAASPDAPKVADAAPVDTKVAETPKVDAPIVYDFKSPEGMELDKAQLDEFKTIATEAKLPNDVAQKFVDLAAKAEVARAESHKATIAGWAESVKTDKDIGGDKLADTIATAKKALELGPPELKQLLNESGMGNHPAVVRFMHTVGKMLSEDRFISGTTAAAPKSLAERLYPNHK